MNASSREAACLKTLIVDDNDLVRNGLRLLVESTAGLELVSEASDVPEALAALREHKPDVAILDLQLPSGTGLDILRCVRQLHPRCRVIMFSASMTEWEAWECRSAGAEQCFNKVLEFERLRETLCDWGSRTGDTGN
jgi:DNA-binding NarL/FixJ family response regulator